MKKCAAVLSGLLLVVCVFVGLGCAGEDEAINAIVEARKAVKEFPLPSAQVPDLTEAKAYAFQGKLVKALVAKGDVISGYKAGLTSVEGQKRFGVSGAILGPLYKAGELGPDAVVEKKAFVRPFIENEVGFVIGEKISAPVKDEAALKKMVKEVFPAVELPDLRYSDMKNLKGTDIIADGVGSSKYIVGKRMPADKVDVNQVKVTMTLDGAPFNEGKAEDAMGDQWKALLWLVNGVIEKGYTIEPGYVFITGALGKMLPAKEGKYEGNYGPLGTLSFTIK
ncbi:MAG: hypothetical protein LDL33_02445 [Desulfomonile sp.]|nr:hypothetical protein [Desulfomonile sp.]